MSVEVEVNGSAVPEPTPSSPKMGQNEPLGGNANPVKGQVIRADSGFMKKVEEESGVRISACYGCKKCSNGCPVTFAMDLHPYQVVRYCQLGLSEKLMDSSTIWVCASCQTCVTRCPNDVDLPRLMDYLKEKVVRGSRRVEEKRVKLFNELFLGEVKARGRVFEGGLMTKFLIKSGDFLGPAAIDNARLGIEMLRRGRLKLMPHGTKDKSWLKPLFKG